MRKNWNKTENKATGGKKEANWEMKPIREKLNVMQKKRQEASQKQRQRKENKAEKSQGWCTAREKRMQDQSNEKASPRQRNSKGKSYGKTQTKCKARNKDKAR